MHLKTPQAAKQLPNCTYHNLIDMIRGGLIDPPPAKDSSGHFIWTPKDIERARAARLRQRSKKVAVCEGGGRAA
jgi:hypothetical protein